MKRKILPIIVLVLFSSCATSKTFIDENGKKFTAEPWGWANSGNRIDGVTYKVSPGSKWGSIIFSQTLVVPIGLTGWQLFQPVGYTPSK